MQSIIVPKTTWFYFYTLSEVTNIDKECYGYFYVYNNLILKKKKQSGILNIKYEKVLER